MSSISLSQRFASLATTRQAVKNSISLCGNSSRTSRNYKSKLSFDKAIFMTLQRRASCVVLIFHHCTPCNASLKPYLSTWREPIAYTKPHWIRNVHYNVVGSTTLFPRLVVSISRMMYRGSCQRACMSSPILTIGSLIQDPAFLSLEYSTKI